MEIQKNGLFAWNIGWGVIAWAILALATLLAGCYWVWVLFSPTLALEIALFSAIFMALAFGWKVKKFGGAFLKSEDVPKKSCLILRWRLGGKAIGGDASRFRTLIDGLVLYSPWLYSVEYEMDLRPIIIPIPEGKGMKVNAVDGVQMKVDCKVICTIIDPISLWLMLGGKEFTREKLEKELQRFVLEYLETGLQRITSVHTVIKNPDGTEVLDPNGHVGYDEDGRSILGWSSSSVMLSGSDDKTQDRMSQYVTMWINERIGQRVSRNSQIQLGFRISVEINVFELPEPIQRAQQTLTTASLEAKSHLVEAEAIATGIGKVSLGTVRSILDDNTLRALTSLLNNNEVGTDGKPLVPIEDKRKIIEMLSTLMPNATLTTAIPMATKLATEIVQLIRRENKPQPKPESPAKEPAPGKAK